MNTDWGLFMMTVTANSNYQTILLYSLDTKKPKKTQKKQKTKPQTKSQTRKIVVRIRQDRQKEQTNLLKMMQNHQQMYIILIQKKMKQNIQKKKQYKMTTKLFPRWLHKLSKKAQTLVKSFNSLLPEKNYAKPNQL